MFSEKFQYTLSDSEAVPSFAVLRATIDHPDSIEENSGFDIDRTRGVELFIEEDNMHSNDATIQAKFTDLVNRLNKACFEEERHSLLALEDKNSAEYLQKYMQLTEKARQLGIKFNRG